MIGRVTSTLVALAGIAGCATYSGGARPLDPLRLTTEPGWIVAAPTPELQQRAPHECGATSLAMVAGRWQVPLSVDEALSELPAENAKGTRLGDLRDVARAHGLEAFAITGDSGTLIHELRAGRPVIVGLLLPASLGRAASHYEVIVAANPSADQFVTIDPASGLRSRSWSDLDAEWGPPGRPALVVLGPEPSGVLARRTPSPPRTRSLDLKATLLQLD